MKKIFSIKKENVQRNWRQYLIINCVFLFPAVLITLLRTQFPQIDDFVDLLPKTIGDLLGLIILPYWLLAIVYHLFGLTYLHCALSLGFLLFFIYKLIKEKCKELFFQVLLLTIVSIVFNIYWLTHGGGYIGV